MRRLLLAQSLASLTLVPSAALGQAYVDFQGSWSDSHDWGIGGRVSPYIEFGFTFGGAEQVKFTVGADVALAGEY